MDALRWAVVGVGIAGRARSVALHESRRDELVALWNGRFAADVAAETGAMVAPSFEAAIARADAVAIASPTEHHAAQVRAALRAGKHVVVEFPVARSRAEAEALFALARHQQRVLHVEHIELLEAAGRTLCAQTRPELLSSVSVHFERSGPDDAGAPALALSNVARLHRLCAVAGEMQSIDTVDASPGELRATLRSKHGVEATCSFLQGPYFQRTTLIDVHTSAASWQQKNSNLRRDGRNVSLLGTRSLFAADQRVATSRILDGEPPYVTEERILHVLDLVERLGRLQTGRVGA